MWRNVKRLQGQLTKEESQRRDLRREENKYQVIKLTG